MLTLTHRYIHRLSLPQTEKEFKPLLDKTKIEEKAEQKQGCNLMKTFKNVSHSKIKSETTEKRLKTEPNIANFITTLLPLPTFVS